MIQIDDAGSGSFVGGTCIGVYRPDSNDYYFDIIPIELYNKENFKSKLYLDEVLNIVIRAFNALNVNRSESIEICRGYMFEKIKPWLNDNNYFFYSTHINGKIQDIVEKNFELYTISLGLPREYIKYTKFPFHFHKLLRWVYSDYENRISLCKVGWNSWCKLENEKPYVTYDISKSSQYFCLKCGKVIKKGCNIKILHFYSNRKYFVFLHTNC